jgi:hypothetical protein
MVFSGNEGLLPKSDDEDDDDYSEFDENEAGSFFDGFVKWHFDSLVANILNGMF